MSKQEELLKKLESDLKIEVIKHFESIDKFEDKYILNSKVTKGTSFEKNKFCLGFDLFNLDELQITDIILGDLEEVSVIGDIKIATSNKMPKSGTNIDLWSRSIFGIRINAEVSFNKDEGTIEVSNVTVFGR